MSGAEMIRKREASQGRNLEHPPIPEPLSVAVYDNHTHLEFEDGIETLNPEESLRRAAAVGVAGVVQVGTDLDTQTVDEGQSLFVSDHGGSLAAGRSNPGSRCCIGRRSVRVAFL